MDELLLHNEEVRESPGWQMVERYKNNHNHGHKESGPLIITMGLQKLQ